MANNESVIVPEELVWLDGRPIVKMVEIAVEALQLPFWSQTLAAKKRVVGLMPLAQFESDSKPMATVSGFVYHFNRCGSTLVSNAFKARSGCFSLSEPFVFQQLLDSEHGTPAQRVEWLKELMGLHSQALAGICKNFVIKWPGLLALYIAEIEQAFPHVPAIFLYRNPVEVLVSARLEPLGNTDIVRQVHLDLPASKQLNDYSALERTGLLMANMCRHVMRSQNIRLVDYASLPTAIWENIAPYFNLTPSPDDLLKMTECGRFHSKAYKTNKVFDEDTSTKNKLANEEERRVSNEIIEPALALVISALPQLCPKIR